MNNMKIDQLLKVHRVLQKAYNDLHESDGSVISGMDKLVKILIQEISSTQHEINLLEKR